MVTEPTLGPSILQVYKMSRTFDGFDRRRRAVVDNVTAMLHRKHVQWTKT